MARKYLFFLVALLIAVNACSLNKGTIKLEAQVDYKMGGPQPVAQTTFYLFNSELTAISKGEREKGAAGNKEALESLDDLIMLQFEMPSIRSASTVEYDIKKAMPLLQPYLVQTQETDFKGVATFSNVPPGDYRLLGVTETRGGYAFWMYKTTVKAGDNVVLLSDKNAEYAK